MKSLSTKNKRTNGFTVLELLIVVAMITILLGIVLASFSKAKKHVDDDAKLSQFQLLTLALEQYRSQCKVYPDELDLQTENGYPTQAGQTQCIKFKNFLHPSVDLALFNYTALGSSNAFAGTGYCSAYHLSTVLQQNNPDSGDLAKDSDYSGSIDLVPCTGNGNDYVDYDDAGGFYDVKYP